MLLRVELGVGGLAQALPVRLARVHHRANGLPQLVQDGARRRRRRCKHRVCQPLRRQLDRHGVLAPQLAHHLWNRQALGLVTKVVYASSCCVISMVRLDDAAAVGGRSCCWHGHRLSFIDALGAVLDQLEPHLKKTQSWLCCIPAGSAGPAPGRRTRRSPCCPSCAPPRSLQSHWH